MKQVLFLTTTLAIFAFIACKNNGSNKQEGHDMKTMNNDSTEHVATADDRDIKPVAVVYTQVDANIAASIKSIVDHYLHIKNALASDNAGEAASGAKAMEEAITKLDKSLFTAEQKTAYDANEAEMKEHAEHIAENGDNIKHQRSHFVQMSEVIYVLVKNFGAGRPVYHDHCPMARDNQGAMWISEVKEIKNPYFGSEMFRCGRVEEVIK